MSTNSALREFTRSWSEENLFQIQSRERILDLETEKAKNEQRIKALEGDVADREDKIKALDQQLHQLRIQVYDLKKYKEKAEGKKLKDKKKKETARKKRHTSRVKKPADSKSDKAAKERSKWEEQEKRIEAMLASVQAADSVRRQSGLPQQPQPAQDEAAGGDPSSDEEEEEEDTFQLDLIAERFPALPLSVVLDCERKFLEADTDNSGLIERKELDTIVRTVQGGSVSPDAVNAIIAQHHLDIDQGLDFLDCMTIVVALKQAPAPAPAPAAGKKGAAPATGKKPVASNAPAPGTAAGPDSKVCAIQ